MAKTTAQRTDAQPVDTTATETAQVMSAATRKLVDGVRDQFKGFVDGMNILLARRAELAPKFMKAARAYMAEMNANFIDFVRELDPTVPETAKEYRNNPVYNAAVYLKRLTDAQQRAERSGGTVTNGVANAGPQPVPAMSALARLIAAIKPLVPEDQLPKLWEVIARELNWSDAQRDRLQRLVDQAAPLFATRTPKGQPKPMLKIAAIPHRHEEGAATAA